MLVPPTPTWCQMSTPNLPPGEILLGRTSQALGGLRGCLLCTNHTHRDSVFHLFATLVGTRSKPHIVRSQATFIKAEAMVKQEPGVNFGDSMVPTSVDDQPPCDDGATSDAEHSPVLVTSTTSSDWQPPLRPVFPGQASYQRWSGHCHRQTCYRAPRVTSICTPT